MLGPRRVFIDVPVDAIDRDVPVDAIADYVRWEEGDHKGRPTSFIHPTLGPRASCLHSPAQFR
jgi:hypothetical protein